MRRALLAVLAAAALLGGCDAGDDSGLVFKDPKGTVGVERGMEFTFELSVNAGVGFDWEAVDPNRLKHAELTGTDVEYPEEEREGDSGVKRFRFRASDTPGDDTIVLRKLYRGDQQERRSITLEVR